MSNNSNEVSLGYTVLTPVRGRQQTTHMVLASNEISSPAWAVYRLTEYAAATAGVLMGQLSPSGTSSRRPRLSNSSQFSTGPQLIRFPAIWEKRLRYSVNRERMLAYKSDKINFSLLLASDLYMLHRIAFNMFRNVYTVWQLRQIHQNVILANGDSDVWAVWSQ